jgi:HTH-type transcriptional regulator / antitoxin HigA
MGELRSTFLFRTTPGSRFHGLITEPDALADGALQAAHQHTSARRYGYGELVVSFLHSPSFKSSREALIAWLRIGEIWADEQECADYNKAAFLRALGDIAELTRRDPEEFVPRMRELCNGAGVAFVLVPALAKTSVSGAARWLNPRKALIQQSDRHKTNDHFWFTFFHEAAHIVLHSKRTVFVDENGLTRQEVEQAEAEANGWAGDLLVPKDAVRRFAGLQRISEQYLLDCARDYCIEPGFLVGRLQHERILPWKNLNRLKRKIEIHQTPDGSFVLASRAA